MASATTNISKNTASTTNVAKTGIAGGVYGVNIGSGYNLLIATGYKLIIQAPLTSTVSNLAKS